MKKHRKLIKEMEERGWAAFKTKKNHIKFVFEQTGAIIILAGTTSDHRSTKNFFSRVRRVEENFQQAQQG